MEQALGDRAAGLLRELKQAQGGTSLPPYNVNLPPPLGLLGRCVAVVKFRPMHVVVLMMRRRGVGPRSDQHGRPSRVSLRGRLRCQEAQLKKVIQEIHWLYEQNNATIE
jgi:hypothetical protein